MKYLAVTMGREIRILLVDDHTLFREGLGRLLEAEPDFRIAGKCASVAEALEILKREEVDVVLLDHNLGEEQGFVLLDNAKTCACDHRVLMVTASMSGAETLQALERGALGVFLKYSPPSELVEAIHKLVNGEMWLDAKAVHALVSASTGKAAQPNFSPPLNVRERAVLKGVLQGLANKEIALKMQISESSVKAVLQRLFDKTGVRTRAQLVRIALEKRPQDMEEE